MHLLKIGLVFSNGLVEYGLLTYLTEHLGITLPTAAQIVNMQEGISYVLIILVAHFAESSRKGLFKVIILATTANVFALAIVLLFGPHPSRGYMLIVSVLLLTLGKAGRVVPLKAFLDVQLQNLVEEKEDKQLLEKCRKVWWILPWNIGRIMAIVFLSIQGWMKLTMMSFIAMLVALVLFLSGCRYCTDEEPTPSPLHNVTKVLKAATSKRHFDYAVSPDQLFQNDTSDAEIHPHNACLRWLDKAAISDPEQAITGRVLFGVAKVREVKNLLNMLPMWLTFVVYSLVEATGSTFFLKQAEQIDDRFAIAILVIVMTLTSFSVSIICSLIYKNDKPHPLPNILWIGMLCVVLCCLTAWRVEVYRLGHSKHISVTWLIPQFVFLGLMDGCVKSGIELFFQSQVCDSMNRYGPRFNGISLSLGKFFSVICIYIFRPWFNQDINTSRLDKYYAMSSVLASLNFCFLACLVRYWYRHQPHDTKILDIAQELEVPIENV